MILLGIILLVVGFFLWRPLVFIGGLLIVIGLILWVTSGVWYGYHAEGVQSLGEVTQWVEATL